DRVSSGDVPVRSVWVAWRRYAPSTGPPKPFPSGPVDNGLGPVPRTGLAPRGASSVQSIWFPATSPVMVKLGAALTNAPQLTSQVIVGAAGTAMADPAIANSPRRAMARVAASFQLRLERR